MNTEFLLTGHDTIECAYYLRADGAEALDFEQLAVDKELLRASKSRHRKPVTLGRLEFLLASHGTKSGYPFLLENDLFSIQCGPNNNPNFFVTFRSQALWHIGASGLDGVFLAWADSVGMTPYRAERLSRVDFTFDVHLPALDFDEDNFVSQAVKVAQYRANGLVQTFSFGREGIQLRVYNKSDEIQESSGKTWFFDLWGRSDQVWRIEWEVRKDWLRSFGIETFAQLQERQGDLMTHIASNHTTLRRKTTDSNRSRWPLHPLWIALQEQIDSLGTTGQARAFNVDQWLDGRMVQLAISVYGYLKRIAAIRAMKSGQDHVALSEAVNTLQDHLRELHDPLSWESDVSRKSKEMRLGAW